MSPSWSGMPNAKVLSGYVEETGEEATWNMFGRQVYMAANCYLLGCEFTAARW